MSNNSQLERKVAKCAGCRTTITEHGWVFPSKFYQGEEISSPIAHKNRQNVTVDGHDEDQQIADFEQELAELGLEEQWQAKQKRISPL